MENTYEFLPFLFLRTPLYSFLDYDRERVPEVLLTTVFQNALWLASPSFYRQLEGKGFTFERLNAKERFTLDKYFNRMCYRPTPFGSFAAFTILEWQDGQTVRMVPDEQLLLHILPDMAVMERLSKTGDERAELLITNPALYRFRDSFRFVQSRPDTSGRARFSLSSIAAEELHIRIFEALSGGGIDKASLAIKIDDWTKCGPAAAGEYIDFLKTEQVLLTSFSTDLHASSGSWASKLFGEKAGWSQRLSADSRLNVPPVAERLPVLAAQVFSLQGRPDEPTDVFYTSLERARISGGPGMADAQQLMAAVGLLQRLHVPYETTALKEFIKAFRSRFGERKVPLLAAIDPDMGIAYDWRLSADPDYGLTDDGQHDKRMPKKMEWTPVHQVLLTLWNRSALADPYKPLAITDEDVSVLQQGQGPGWLLPNTLAVMFRKTAEHLVIDQIGGATATSVIGRFSVFSTQAAAFCRELARAEAEANPDVILAELLLLSEGHTDNVNRRLPCYDQVIPLNTYSHAQGVRVISLSDLVVYVQDGELILESVSSQKRVIPRLPTAFNYLRTGLPLFRLLCDLQYQGQRGTLAADLERLFPNLHFYPRLEYGGVVLSLAKWILDEAESAQLTKPDVEVTDRVRQLRSARQLPRKITLGINDQQLVFDLADPAECAFFVKCLPAGKKVILYEHLDPGRFLKVDSRPYAGQFVAFLKHAKELWPAAIKSDLIAADVQRTFPPGSEWLYLKLYCTPAAANAILAALLFPLVKRNARQIKNWFFIRYQDEGGHHLRFRLKAEPAVAVRLLGRFSRSCQRDNAGCLIRDVVSASYERELERYGVDLIEAVEEAFCYGSEVFCRCLDEADTKLALDEFRLGLLCTRVLLEVFFTEIEDRRVFCRQMAEAFAAEFKTKPGEKVDLDRRYRSLRPVVTEVMVDAGRPEVVSSVTLDEYGNRLKSIYGQGKTDPARKLRLAADIGHMQLNRVFPVDRRSQEYFIYYCINKFYTSEMAKLSKTPGQV